jgi:hypothetical protein
MSEMPALGKLKQEDCEFLDSLPGEVLSPKQKEQ